MFLFPACIAASAVGAKIAAANTATDKKNTNAMVKVPLQPVLYSSAGSRAAPAATASGIEVPMHLFATVSVLSRTFLRYFTWLVKEISGEKVTDIQIAAASKR